MSKASKGIPKKKDRKAEVKQEGKLDVMVKATDATSISGISLSRNRLKDLKNILATVIGKEKYSKMKKAGNDLLPALLSSLPNNLRELKEKEKADIKETVKMMKMVSSRTTLREIKENLHFFVHMKMIDIHNVASTGLPSCLKGLQEASKFVYSYMRDQKRKTTRHPPHIRDIPRDWVILHRDAHNKDCLMDCEFRCSPDKPVLESIANYTGLQLTEVKDVFNNFRKREAKKDPDLADSFKGKFPPFITIALRNWQKTNPGKWPKGDSLNTLRGKTGLNVTQVRDWYNNHNRNRSKKRFIDEAISNIQADLGKPSGIDGSKTGLDFNDQLPPNAFKKHRNGGDVLSHSRMP